MWNRPSACGGLSGRLFLGFFLPVLLSAGPRLDRWRVIGPGGGGAQFIPTVSPHDPSRVLVRCDMTGSYITHDAGASWRMFNLRAATSFFVFDPVDPNTIYAAGLGLWRSTDAGASWRLVYPHPDSVTGVRIAGDHGEETILTSGPAPAGMTALAVDPAGSATLYAAIGGALHVSSDSGATWTQDRAFPDGATRIWIDPASPAADRTLYVAGARSIGVRERGQWRFNPAPAPVASFADVALGWAGDGPPVIYAAVGATVIVTEDAGATWREASLPGRNPRVPAIATSLYHPDTVYASYSNLTEPDGRYWFGVARSTDRGRTWDLAWKSANQQPPNIEDAWLSAALNPTWSGNPLSLGVAPTDPEICYGTDYGRTMRTTDGGRTWKAVYSAPTPGGAFTTTGLDVTTAYGVHWDPHDPARMFISYTDIVLHRSENGGESWQYSGAGVPSNWRNTVYWMAFDPLVPGRVWAAMARTHDLPRPKMWRRTAVSTYDGGIGVSDDGGRTWRRSGVGMPPTAATDILLDPASPPDARVLYAAGFGRGVYKSSDGGLTWDLRNNGIAGDEPFAWRFARDPSGTLYLVVARRSENGSYGNAGDGALYVSSDGADSWTCLPLPAGLNGPNGLAIDPEDPQRLYLAAWGRYNRNGDTGGGVWLSTDGGATWRNTLSADQHVYDVTIDPRNGVLYAAGFESSAWRSADRGETWQRIRGFNFKWGHRVIPDPRDPAFIYITAFGGSVWHGPAEGDPEAPEDIAGPPPLMFTKDY